MKRLTKVYPSGSIGVTGSIQDSLIRLCEIEDILGDEYNLDRLHEIVEADNDKRCVIFEKGYGIVSLYEKDDEGFVNRTVCGVVTREEYDQVLKGDANG